MAVTRDVVMRLGAKQAAGLKSAWGAVGKGISKVRAGVKGMLGSFMSLKTLIIGAIAIKGLGALKRAIVDVVGVAAKQEAAEAKLAAVIKATGYAAGFSAKEMYKQAAAMQGLTVFGDEIVMETQAIIATFKNIKGDSFKTATMAALDMATVLGTDAKSGAIQLGKALNDPIKGVAMLSRVGVTFTDQQKAQIKAMGEMGDTAGAQGIILGELQSQFGGAAEAEAKTFGGLVKQMGNFWGDLKEQIGEFITKSPAVRGFIEDVKNGLERGIETLKKYGPILRDRVNKQFAKAAAWVKELWQKTRQWVEKGGLVETWYRVKTGLMAVKALGHTVLAGFTGIAYTTGQIWKVALWGMNKVGLVSDSTVDKFDAYLAMLKKTTLSVGDSWRDVADAAEGVNFAAAKQGNWLAELNNDLKKLKNAQEEVTDEGKKQLDNIKEINAQEEKRFKSIAEQYGMMTALEREQVRGMAERLKGAGGYEAFLGMGEAERGLVGKSKLLQDILSQRGFAETTAERELGTTMREVKALTKIETEIKVAVEAKLEVGGKAMAEQIEDAIVPEIKKSIMDTIAEIKGDIKETLFTKHGVANALIPG